MTEQRINKKIIVLAGNFEQFQFYVKDNFEIKDKLIYGDFPDRLRGLEAEKVEVIGTFWDRKDAGKLKDFAECFWNTGYDEDNTKYTSRGIERVYGWKTHLTKMILEKEPLLYLKRFL